MYPYNPYYYDSYLINPYDMNMPDYMQPMVPQQPMVPIPPSPETGIDVPGLLPAEQSYIENILRLNLGKIATIYMTFENNKEWNAKVFKGSVEAAGRDHIIISDPQTGRRYLLLMVNLDYITFDEELNYVPPTVRL
ncbi:MULTISPECIES: spore coat protein GerQ [Tepidibacillus]|uniref:Spore coat protein GerQ n=1 Tax=Tepidibacillus decaturensis TaxID=1413211 RepID=A0A135L6S4_9BACI|nr:spore coat protein GerQ [Tepidibacillus decaturensis]GBF12516.1 spore coat protein GerQ [Tepidibacillus sp. HK-1]